MKKLLLGMLVLGNFSCFAKNLECKATNSQNKILSNFTLKPMEGSPLHVADNYIAHGNSSPAIVLQGFVYVVSSAIILDSNEEIQMQNFLVSRRKDLKGASIKNIKMEQLEKQEYWNNMMPKTISYRSDILNVSCNTKL